VGNLQHWSYTKTGLLESLVCPVASYVGESCTVKSLSESRIKHLEQKHSNNFCVFPGMKQKPRVGTADIRNRHSFATGNKEKKPSHYGDILRKDISFWRKDNTSHDARTYKTRKIRDSLEIHYKVDMTKGWSLAEIGRRQKTRVW